MDLVLLYSGGLESRCLLDLALKLGHKPVCVLVNYKQTHLEELSKAKEVCEKLGIEHQTIEVSWPVRSALTSKEDKLYEGVSEWYVPARNLLFISLAAGIAETRGIDTVWFGASYDDRLNRFPDCYQEWVVSVNEVLEKSLSKKIQVEAPFLGWTKKRVWEWANYSGIKKEEVFSGYGR